MEKFLGSWSIDFTSWSWWTSQFFAFLLLVCLIVSMQQKTRTKLMWWNTVGMFFGVVGAIFLGFASVIILMTINFSRNVTVLIFSYFPNAKQRIFWSFGAALIIAVTTANLIFWENWLSGMSIAVGIGFIVAFFQMTPKRMRFGLCIMRFPACAFAILTTNLVQAVTETVAFTSGLIAIIRLDMKKKPKEDTANTIEISDTSHQTVETYSKTQETN